MDEFKCYSHPDLEHRFVKKHIAYSGIYGWIKKDDIKIDIQKAVTKAFAEGRLNWLVDLIKDTQQNERAD